jgi:hypothetical protein
VNTFVQFVLGIALLGWTSPVLSQSGPFTIGPGQKQKLSLPDVVAAFSKDPSVARTSAVDGAVTIEGVAKGDTEIVILTQDHGKQVISVKCIAAGHEKINKQELKGESAEEPPLSEPRTGTTVGERPSPENQVGPTIPSNTFSDNQSWADSSFRSAAEEPISGSSLSDGARRIDPEKMLPSAMASVGETVRVRELTQILVPVSQVSAAYSLNSLVAEAQMESDQVRIWGRAPGQAVIVLVHADFSTTSMQVRVTQAAPILPDREWSGLNSSGLDSKGYYEVILASGPLQVSDTLDYRTSRVQLHFNNANVLQNNVPGTPVTRFPYSYLSFLGNGFLGRPWKLTLVDDNVDSSPISVSSTVLRGIHFSAAGLTIHAGYTSIAGFQSLFIPAHKQLISGAAFSHSLSGDSQVGVTGYYIQRDAFALDRQTAEEVGTLFFKRHPLHGTDVSAEVGLSEGIGGAFSLTRNTDADQFYITARYRPREYAAADTDNLKGLQSEARWDHFWGKHFISDFSGSDTHIYTQSGAHGAQTIETAIANLRYKAFNGVSLGSGVSVSEFSDDHNLFPSIRRIAVPITLSYDRSRFGVGARYEYSQTSQAFSAGQGYGGSFRWSGQHFQMGVNAGLDTQALGVDSVFSAFPGLNVALAQLGLGANTSIEQLVILLQNRAFLNSLGIAPSATLQLIPRNSYAGLNLSWPSGRQVLELNSNYNRNSFLTQQSTTVLQTVRYRRGLTNSTELVTSFTLLDSLAPTHRWSPVWEIGLRHQFGNSPFPHLHQHNGIISGAVRLQDRLGTHPVQAAEITLDGERRTTSNSQGCYRFSSVRTGVHSVQITFKSSRPFWYTTSSKVSTTADSIVDFGIMHPAAQVTGYVLNDAGMGLPDIGVLLKGPQGEMNLTTDQAGKFVTPVAQTGAYSAHVKVESVPDGYALEDLQLANISVGEGEFKKVSFTLPAIRALGGSVQVYDSAKEAYISLTGVTVEIAELKRQTITDGSGRYSFRNMPSGIFTILVNGRQSGQVQLSAAPQLLHHDIKLSSSALALANR